MVELKFIPEDFENEPDYVMMGIDLLVSLSDLKLSMLIDYIDRVEQAIGSGLELIQKEVKKTRSESYSDHLIEEWIIGAQHWPEFLHRSVVITVHSVIENILNDFCEEVAEKKRSPIRYWDLKDRGIQRAIKYLKKVGQVHFDYSDPDWRILTMLQKVRNYIIHNDGVIRKDDDVLPAEIMNFDHIEVNDSREIKLSLEFSKDVISAAGRFIHDLAGKIRKCRRPACWPQQSVGSKLPTYKR